MGKFVIQGQKSLRGRVKVSGAKNSALKLMAASILGSGRTRLENIPLIEDVRTTPRKVHTGTSAIAAGESRCPAAAEAQRRVPRLPAAGGEDRAKDEAPARCPRA